MYLLLGYSVGVDGVADTKEPNDAESHGQTVQDTIGGTSLQEHGDIILFLELFLSLDDLLRHTSVRSVGAGDQLSLARSWARLSNSRHVRSVVLDGRGLHSLQSNGCHGEQWALQVG